MWSGALQEDKVILYVMMGSRSTHVLIIHPFYTWHVPLCFFFFLLVFRVTL